MKPTWILKDCEQEALENTLNDLDLGYVPWELRYIDVQDDPQDSVNPRKVVRILARWKWVSEQLPK